MKTRVEVEGDTLIVTRIYDAPREEVFDAWVEVSKVQLWWGCAMTRAVRSEVEPRVGGRYRHHMTIEGAGEMTQESKFTVFERPSRLAYHAEPPVIEGQRLGEGMTVTVEFRDLGEQTEVCLTHTGLSLPILREQVPMGWSAAFDKLGRFLKGDPSLAAR